MNEARLYSKSKLDAFSKVIFPATIPFLINGIRIGIGMAFIMLFVGELSGASSGLGYFISQATSLYRSDMLIAGLITLGGFAAATDYLFVKICKKLFPWVDA